MKAEKASCGFAALLAFAGCTAVAGTISSLSCESWVNTAENPTIAVAASSDSVEIAYAGDWFASGSCDLYVDGVWVGGSTGTPSTYALPGVADGYQAYEVTLVADGEERSRIVTVFPYLGYVCSIHSASQYSSSLDSHPGGTLRKLGPDASMPVSWSELWNASADRAVVTLYSGADTNGVCLGELVRDTAGGEGSYLLSPSSLSLAPGRYTLTHFDGTETLFAWLKVSGGAVMIVR